MQIPERNVKLRRAGEIVVRSGSKRKRKNKKCWINNGRWIKWPRVAPFAKSIEYMYSVDSFRSGHLNSGFIAFCLFLCCFFPRDYGTISLLFDRSLSVGIYFPWNFEANRTLLIERKQKNRTNECVNMRDIIFGLLSAPRHSILRVLEYEIETERLIPPVFGKKRILSSFSRLENNIMLTWTESVFLFLLCKTIIKFKIHIIEKNGNFETLLLYQCTKIQN